MSISVDEILEKMDDIIDSGANVPLTKSRIVKSEDLKDLIYELRHALPNEIREAQELVALRNQWLDEAKADAEQIVREAEERARAVVSQQEVTRMANNMAMEIKQSAQKQAMDTRSAAFEYAGRMLEQLEENFVKDYDILASCLDNIRKSRVNLQKSQG